MTREEALHWLDTIPTIGEQVDALEMAIKALEQEPKTEWNNHQIACMLADLFGDACACNYNGIDEWLPELCDFKDTCCPNPIGVACWEQFLKYSQSRYTECGYEIRDKNALQEPKADTWSIKEVADTLEKHGLLEQEPCEDCISRNHLIDSLNKKGIPYNAEVNETIMNMPSVKQEPKTGRWEQYGDYWKDKFKCSECGKEQPKILCDERIIGHWSDFCPNCGARMEVQE